MSNEELPTQKNNTPLCLQLSDLPESIRPMVSQSTLALEANSGIVCQGYVARRSYYSDTPRLLLDIIGTPQLDQTISDVLHYNIAELYIGRDGIRLEEFAQLWKYAI